MSQYFTATSNNVPANIPINFITNAGTAVSSANNINVVGAGATSTSGAGNTVTITTTANVLTWTDEAVNFAAAANNGYFVTAVATATLPAASQGQIVIIECDTASVVTIQCQGTQFISVGAQTSVMGGKATSSKTGDSLYLVYRNATSTWHSISTEGTWAIT